MWATTEIPPTLRLAINDLDSLLICNGKAPMIAKVEELVKTLEATLPRTGSTGGPATIAEQPQYGSYAIMYADPVHVEKVIRTLLAGRARI